MGNVPPPSLWQVPILVSGERPGPAAAGTGVKPSSLYRRVRLLEMPITRLERFAEAVRMESGEARIEALLGGLQPEMGDGWFASSAQVLETAAERVESSERQLAAAVRGAMRSFGDGRPPGWKCGEKTLDLASRPLVMGILNITPDSFSGDGLLLDPGRVEECAWRMVEDGADIIDIGGESTRPGSQPVPVEEELRRVLPVLGRLGGRLPVPLSIDTSRAQVAQAGLERGVTIINDITGMTGDPEMLRVASESSAGLVLMHMQGSPQTMQDNPRYDDLVREVFLWLYRRVGVCVDAGIVPERIVIDPGIGFGKTGDHNLTLIYRLREFTSAGLPVLAGPSRKGFLGKTLDLPVNDRVEGTGAACTAAVLNGASMVRVHDVKAVSRAVRVAAAIELCSIA